MNPDLLKLQPYPFEKLAKLKGTTLPPADKTAINLAIGEPRHCTPAFISEEIITHLHGLSHYPLTRGTLTLRQSIADWLIKRFRLPVTSIDAEKNILPVNGTREALFAFAQAVIDRSRNPLVLMPNPFYQIYEGAALLAGAEPWFINISRETGWQADFSVIPPAIWERCQLLYLCSPGNPTGAVINADTLGELIGLAERYDFVIASDECYSEIYLNEDAPPTGLLEAAARLGHDNYQRCIVFHSLSKRSNVPGMRSGFVAGDADIIRKFLLYRTYHGCAMPPYVQVASAKAWGDELHVRENRRLYLQKFAAVLEILQDVMKVERPEAGFYLWPETPVDDEIFARELFIRENVTVLPGSYLSRLAQGKNPGSNHIRIALVASLEECIDAAQRIRNTVINLN